MHTRRDARDTNSDGRGARGLRRPRRLTRPVTVMAGLTLALLATLTIGPVVAPPPAETYEGIDAYPTYTRPVCLDPVAQPGVREFRDMVLGQVGVGRSGGIHACTGFEHGEGRAWDWMMSARSSADRRRVEEVLSWLLRDSDRGVPHANARRLGIGYIIWNRQIIQLWDHLGEKTWKPYVGRSPHTDHVHFSFSWPGARQETSFWVRQARSQTWHLASSLSATIPVTDPFRFGEGGSVALVGDWNGDGVDTPGSYDPRRRRFALRDSLDAGGADIAFVAGRFGDTPLAGDWDGDGRDEVGLYRTSTNQFLFLGRSAATTAKTIVFGLPGDLPLVGDFDPAAPGDEVGFYRRDNRTFYLRHRDGSVHDVLFGVAGDVPVVGDWNAATDGGIGVFRPSTRTFILRMVAPGGGHRLSTIAYGEAADVPLVGDWTGSGTDSIGVRREEQAG